MRRPWIVRRCAERVVTSSLLLGIEIGGTKLQLGLGDGTGQVLAIERRTVVPALGAGPILDQIREAGEVLIKGAGLARPAAVAVGFGGPVDSVAMTVLTSNQVSGWDGFPLGQWLADTFETTRRGRPQ